MYDCNNEYMQVKQENTAFNVTYSTVICLRLVGWLEINVPFQQKYDYIRDESVQGLGVSNCEAWHLLTSSSAIAEGPRDALSQLKSCQLLHNCMKNHIWLEGVPFHVV